MINLKNFAVSLSLPVFSTLVFVSPSHAFRLSFQPTGEIVKNPGETVDFFLFMSDFRGRTLSQLTFNFDFDSTEIVNPNVKSAPNSGGMVIRNNQKSHTITGLNEKNPGGGLVSVGSVSFNVINSVQDFQPDFWLTGAKANANAPVVTAAFAALDTGNISSEETVDVSPEYANIIPSSTSVPEPLTILGSVAALGIGITLKKRQKQTA